MIGDSRVVIFSRSAGGGALEALTCEEGVTMPSEVELPAGSELGFFAWPDEETSDTSFVQAVVPGEDGRIVARWPDPWTG